jgi:hypothetical protein
MSNGNGNAKRTINKDLEVRIAGLERKMLELGEQLGKIDERVAKIATTVANMPLRTLAS